MPQIESQCTNCGAFARRSLHHEEEYQSSVLLERLRISNSPATDEEILHVRHNILPTVSDDIFSIDSKVASLREVIMAMEEERERLKIVQKKYNNLVSLHRALPSEIWSEIFLCTLSDDSDFNAFDASGSIWRLSHVCEKWRNITLSLRSFWSTIDIQFPPAAQQEGGVQRLETIIQRSRQGPLDISLTSAYHQRPTSDPSLLKRILDIVVAESYRWRKLHVSDYRGILNMLYAPLHNRLPRLECLSLRSVHVEPKEQSVFKDCPSLTNVMLEGSSPVVEFPWDQITELSLVDLDGGEEELRACMRLIELCTSLEILSLPYWYLEDDEVASPYPPTTCSNVHKFATRSARVIDALTLPRLREAFLNPESLPTQFDILYSFKQLLIRSNCLNALTSLSLISVPLAASSKHSLLSILSQTHSLTFLELELALSMQDETDTSEQEQILAIMRSLEVLPTESVTFLPLLSSLDIRVFDHPASQSLLYFGPVGSFASTIKARRNGDDTGGLARLRTCHFAVHAQYLQDNIYREPGIFVPRIFNEAERSIFDALIDDGMDLIIRVTSDLTRSVGGNRVVFAVPESSSRTGEAH